MDYTLHCEFFTLNLRKYYHYYCVFGWQMVTLQPVLITKSHKRNNNRITIIKQTGLWTNRQRTTLRVSWLSL